MFECFFFEDGSFVVVECGLLFLLVVCLKFESGVFVVEVYCFEVKSEVLFDVLLFFLFYGGFGYFGFVSCFYDVGYFE